MVLYFHQPNNSVDVLLKRRLTVKTQDFGSWNGSSILFVSTNRLDRSAPVAIKVLSITIADS